MPSSSGFDSNAPGNKSSYAPEGGMIMNQNSQNGYNKLNYDMSQNSKQSQQPKKSIIMANIL